jgi:hypothetical protein
MSDGESSEYEEVDALDDSDDDFAYENLNVEEFDELDDELLADDDDLESAMRSLRGLTGLDGTMVGGRDTASPEMAASEVTKRPELPFLGRIEAILCFFRCPPATPSSIRARVVVLTPPRSHPIPRSITGDGRLREELPRPRRDDLDAGKV